MPTDLQPSPSASMTGFASGYRALVIGASGAIGAAFVAHLRADSRCAAVIGLHRQSEPALDLRDEASVAVALAQVGKSHGPFSLVIHAAGVLHGTLGQPEKRLADLNLTQLADTFLVNTLGPALVLRHGVPLLAKERAVMVFLSAKVGSIGDNRLGGWYSYRASKAALNMLVKTAAIEVARTQPQAVIVAMHPGTVTSALSAPFGGQSKGRSADLAAREMLAVVDALQPQKTGQFVAYDGSVLPW